MTNFCKCVILLKIKKRRTVRKMIKIAIVDDEKPHSDILESYLARYAAEKNLEIRAEVFSNAVAFLTDYRSDFDIVFMDIRMQYMDGLTAAKRLRELDGEVVLIFVTSLAKYAVDGYAVDAADYIVKPFAYPDFALKMARAVKRIPRERAPIVIRSSDGIIRIDPALIVYVETDGHRVVFHTDGKDYTQYSSLNAVEKLLRDRGFSRCNTSYLVNLRYVEKIVDYTVTVKGKELLISHPRKKAFTEDCVAYGVER